ncbi:hypothetical protein OPT61_g3542 [Boeremia exigua]|uniref:Uncharacterized protein n=1 Tax=Boeremia exigua TaxID=749465 RepID=A0ACC2IHE7_9PLEO|nr:hypothetical protein OPT61_g3542 [Boeremia exigua]
MSQEFDNDPQVEWDATYEKWQKIIGGSPQHAATVNDLHATDKSSILKETISSVDQVAKQITSVAGTVFPHAQIVLQALEYLGGTIQWYDQKFNAKKVLDQLKDVSWNLDRIRIYIEYYEENSTLDQKLLGIITQIMTVFLRLCLIHEKVKRDAGTALGTLKNIYRSMIRWDQGIKSSIEEIKEMSNREMSVNIASLRGANLNAEAKSRKSENSKNLRRLLNLSETNEYWVARQDGLKQQCVPNVGDWLFEGCSKFNSWSDLKTPTEQPILWVSGRPGYGKTFLCSRVVTHLQDRFLSEGASGSCQVSVAWYYLKDKGTQSTKFAKKPRTTEYNKPNAKQEVKKRTAFCEALSALVWQIAQNDTAFQNFVVEDFRKHPRADRNSKYLWENLIEAFCKQGGSRQRRFFLIIDGGDTSMDKQDLEFLATMRNTKKQENSNHQFRVMISQTVSELSKSKDNAGIELPKDSPHADSEAFIDHILKDLFESYPPGTNGYRTLFRIKKSLVSMFHDEKTDDEKIDNANRINYNILSSILVEVKRISRSDYGLRELRKFEEDLKEKNVFGIFDSIITPNQLERLDRELSDEEKDLLNVIISLMVCLKNWPTAQQLAAFLSLQKKSSSKSLTDQIQDKFPNILAIQSENIVEAIHIERFFREMKNDRWSVSRQGSSTHDFDQTHKVELEKLKSFQAPTLDDWFDSCLKMNEKRTLARPKLQFDGFQSHMTIIKQYLTAVCDEDHRERTELECLQSYTGVHLLWNIWKVKETGLLKSSNDASMVELKKKIGYDLGKLFRDKCSVRIWLYQSDPQHLREDDWCLYLEDVCYWLEDNHVWAGFQESTKNESPKKTRSQAMSLYVPSNDDNPTHSGGDKMQTRTPLEHMQSAAPATHAVENQEDPNLDRTAENKDMSRQETSAPPRESQPDLDTDKRLNDLLSTVIEVSAFQWLQDFRWDALQTLKWLITVAYCSFENVGSDKVKYPTVNLANVSSEDRTFIRGFYESIEKNTAPLIRDQIKEAEVWASNLLGKHIDDSSLKSVKDVRLARTLFSNNPKHDRAEAEKLCEIAQHNDSSFFEATLCLSEIFEDSGDKTKALQELIKIGPKLHSSDYMTKSPSRWQSSQDRFWRLCNETNSAKAALSACKVLSEQSLLTEEECRSKTLEWILKTKDLEDSFSALSSNREMDGKSLLTVTLQQEASNTPFHQHLHLAFESHSNQLLRSYSDAILASTDDDDLATLYLRYWYGVSLFYQERVRDALLKWEDICEVIKKIRKPHKDLGEVFVRTAERLATAYMKDAKDYKNKREGSKSHKYDKKTLSKNIDKIASYREWMQAECPHIFDSVALLLGRLYHLTGQPRKAREMVQEHLMTGFVLLDDEKTQNDRKGYSEIAEATLYLDDRTNALAAWSLVLRGSSEEDNEEEAEEVDGLSIPCAGSCGWVWDPLKYLNKDIWLCQDCAHVGFEATCYKQFTNGSLKSRVCGPDHSFVKMPKMKRKDRERIDSGYVLVGKKSLEIETWLQAVRRQYGIPQRGQSGTTLSSKVALLSRDYIDKSRSRRPKVSPTKEVNNQALNEDAKFDIPNYHRMTLSRAEDMSQLCMQFNDKGPGNTGYEDVQSKIARAITICFLLQIISLLEY